VNKGQRVTRLMPQTENGWKVIHDHASAAPATSPTPSPDGDGDDEDHGAADADAAADTTKDRTAGAKKQPQ